MNGEIFLAVPTFFGDLWYLYDLALLAIVAACIVLILLLRKRTKARVACKLLTSAAKNFKTIGTISDAARIKIYMLSALNLLRSAEYYYSAYVDEKDAYDLAESRSALRELIGRAEESSSEGAADVKEHVREFIGALELIKKPK
ncbi:MAG: hypothetical protein LBT20_04010 [Clostridiales bacterium]|jgi:hypothetical protein|nr:hypothetical protein [Clostridiales bacterium]